jgi:hypothetical protein
VAVFIPDPFLWDEEERMNLCISTTTPDIDEIL